MYMQAMVCVKPRKQETLSCVAYQTTACMHTISSDHCFESFKSGHFVLRGQEPFLQDWLVDTFRQLAGLQSLNSETLCTCCLNELLHTRSWLQNFDHIAKGHVHASGDLV